MQKILGLTIAMALALSLPAAAGEKLQDSLVGVAGRSQCSEKFRDVIGASCLHSDVDGSVTKVHAMVSAIVCGLDDVGAMLCEDSGEPVQCSRIVGKMNP